MTYGRLDGSPFDLLAQDGRRYKILAGIDVFTRRGFAILADQEDTKSVLLLLRSMILAFGVPRRVRTDGGSAFVGAHFRRSIKDLGVEHLICPPFRGDKKPFIERFNGTLQHEFAEQLPGFAGHSVDDRAKLRGRRSFEQRRGKTEPQILGAVLSVDEIRTLLAAWIELYNSRPHSALPDGRSPDEMAAAWTGPIERISDARALDTLLLEGGRKIVGRKGVRHRGRFYWHDDLIPLVGFSVFVSLPGDAGRLLVFSLDRCRFICEALDVASVGIDRQTLAIAAALGQKLFLSQQKKAIKKLSRGFNASVLRAKLLEAREADPLCSVAEVLERSTPEIEAAALAAAADAAAARSATPLLGRAAPMTTSEHAQLDAAVEEIMAPKRGAHYDEEREAQAAVERYQRITAIPRNQWAPEDNDFVNLAEPLPEIQALNLKRRRA